MPGHSKLVPPDQRKRKTWDSSKMAMAIKCVRNKQMGYLKAAKQFGIPRATLFRLAKSEEPDENVAAATKLGGRTVLPTALEKELVAYCIKMESLFYGLTRTDVRQMAYQLAVRNNVDNPFGKSGIAGKDWLRRFMQRHKDVLAIRKPTGTSHARATGFNREEVHKFFDLLDSLFAQHQFSAERVFNVDETGLSVVQSKIPQIIGLKGKRQIGALTAAERGSLMTVIVCMSAGGSFVPPMIIFPRKNMSQHLMRGAPPGSISACHPSGWVQSNLFKQWFEHFIEKTKPSDDSPVLLIMDGHYSHTRNIDVIELAREHNVHLVSLPPHCTHKMQPLDRTFMSPLKSYYSEEIRTWLRKSDRNLGPFDIVELFGNAYLKSQSGEIAVNGFKVTGIFPPNRNVFSEHDFIAASLGRTEDAQQIAQEVGQLPEATEPIAGPSTATVMVSPYDISPVPPKKKTTRRGRPKGSAQILTSSPYKRSLEDSFTARGNIRKAINSTRGRGRGKKLSTTKKIISKPQFSDSSDSDIVELQDFSDEDTGTLHPQPQNTSAKCVFCGTKFSEDVRGEIWVQCLQCEMWAHEECAGCDREQYVCDYCK
ncbi:tigger transposable element-derived protein 1-like [Periplaneta americana]|uniref:tigger transposable element-derived protein 1-like n=1 Tax=Periplaneta americana TaxID=6978 RepID=UPI0037E7682E